MRKLFLAVALVLLAFSVDAQIIRANAYHHYIPVAGGYCAEYQAVYDAMTTKPTTYDADQNTLVVDLKAGGVWAKGDVIYVFAQETNGAGEALLNWIDPDGDDNATNVHSTAFTANEGFTGDGTNDYLNSNYTPSSEGVNWSQNSACLSVYTRIDQDASTYTIGTSDGTYRASIIVSNAGGEQQDRINATNSNQIAVTSGAGLHTASRTESNRHYSYYNATSLGTNNVASTGVPTAVVGILGLSTSASSSNQVSFVFIGGGLTSGEVSALYTAVEKYMDALGKGVNP